MQKSITLSEDKFKCIYCGYLKYWHSSMAESITGHGMENRLVIF